MSEQTKSLRDVILAAGAEARRNRLVPVPDCWGQTIYVGVMSGIERDTFECYAEAIRKKEPGQSRNIRAMLVVLTACDQAGRRIFTLADADRVGDLDWETLDRIWDVAIAANKIGGDEVQKTEGN